MTFIPICIHRVIIKICLKTIRKKRFEIDLHLFYHTTFIQLDIKVTFVFLIVIHIIIWVIWLRTSIRLKLLADSISRWVVSMQYVINKMAPKWFDYNKIIMDNHHQLCLQETKNQWYQSLSKIKHASRRIFLYLSFVSGFSNMIFKSREKVIWKYCIYVFVNILRYTNLILTLYMCIHNTNMDIFAYLYTFHYNC